MHKYKIRIFILVIVTSVLLFKLPQQARSENKKFDVYFSSSYRIDNDGNSLVTSSIKIKNNTKYEYIPFFTIKFLGLSDIRNIKAESKTGKIPVVKEKDEDSVIVKLVFNEKIVGEGKINEFNLSYESNEIAKNNGGFWEVSIPSIEKSNEFADYNVMIEVPDSFGKLSISKPAKRFNEQNFFFKKEEIGDSGVYLIFGNSRVYSFTIDYQISNSNIFPVKSEVAIPSDTNYQDVIINKISPLPENVLHDTDGNWLSIYSLNPFKQLKVTVSGFIKVNSAPKKETLSEKNKKLLLQNQKYWEIDNTNIKNTASNLETPEQIYNFVVKKLKYSYSKVSKLNDRYGAIKALENPDQAACLEFTDLFIALARASGIPARSVEGYAYTQNSKLKPLSLIKDILHAWPEYYDENNNTWIMVDPTWGYTTKGSDYLNSLDLQHIAFIKKGGESIYPITPGEYKINETDKNIKVSFAKIKDFVPKNKLDFEIGLPSYYLPYILDNLNITVINNGNVAVSDKKISVSDFSNRKTEISTGYIPPFGRKVISGIIFPPILTNKEYEFKILVDRETYIKKVKINIVEKYQILYMTGGVIFVGFSIFALTRKIRSISF